jgi:hypothetical protein
MKALSVKQPWADQICTGEKSIEFRSRPISHRGSLLICSSKSATGYEVTINGKQRPLPLGVMLVVVNLIDCRPMKRKDLKQPGAPSSIDGWWCWVFADELDILIPKPVKGMVNLFNVDDKDIESAPVDKYWYDYM